MLVQFIYLSVYVCVVCSHCVDMIHPHCPDLLQKVSLFPTHLLLHTSVSVEISLCVCEMSDFLVHQD